MVDWKASSYQIRRCSSYAGEYLFSSSVLCERSNRPQICFSSVSPLQEASAIGFEQAEKEGFWESSKEEMQRKMSRFNEIWKELDLPVSSSQHTHRLFQSLMPKA